MLKAVVVALTLVAAQPSIAGQLPSGSSPAMRLGALRPQATQPYKSLFKATTLLPPVATQRAATDPSKPTVVCGMTLVPTNPQIDPKMNVTPKTDGTRYTIRAVDPPICRAPTPPAR